jgi:hypothetical protein
VDIFEPGFQFNVEHQGSESESELEPEPDHPIPTFSTSFHPLSGIVPDQPNPTMPTPTIMPLNEPLFLQNAYGVSPDNHPIPTFSTSFHPISGIVPELITANIHSTNPLAILSRLSQIRNALRIPSTPSISQEHPDDDPQEDDTHTQDEPPYDPQDDEDETVIEWDDNDSIS